MKKNFSSSKLLPRAGLKESDPFSDYSYEIFIDNFKKGFKFSHYPVQKSSRGQSVTYSKTVLRKSLDFQNYKTLRPFLKERIPKIINSLKYIHAKDKINTVFMKNKYATLFK